ncbi:hypothetical protein KGF56_002572 [Candida oxycetoniae]|uniref:Transcription factor CBF/NF-Y/archaeal histone domain-containing protein n=1 Tax=Candida oxycetoniae TaxID=497107 RepID=A0AAI9SXP5_9ASCO|nr:uncharacterized protein KGF56_002572 [Candida oxycetoniae]KAI3404627.2 hypothetical protein KGF56_002572 [Candida oxycetoniae]
MSNLRHLMNYDNNKNDYLSNRSKTSISNLIDTTTPLENNTSTTNFGGNSHSHSTNFGGNSHSHATNFGGNNHTASFTQHTGLPLQQQQQQPSPSALPNYNYNFNNYTSLEETQPIEEQPLPQEASQVDHHSPKASSSASNLNHISQEQILSSFEKIKTHFPAARIKKIMQSDEEIGKVAQATPIIVGRALEIFMANLVEVSILQAKKQGAKRITASHIKSAIENTEQFDFLVEAVEKYPSLKN